MASIRRFPLNPDYGHGIYRRRIRLWKGDGRVHGHIFDDFHDMTCMLNHDDVRVTAIRADITRAPLSTCPGAVGVIEELVGMELRASRRAVYGEGRPQRNCTHIFDLAVFAMRHAAMEKGLRSSTSSSPTLHRRGHKSRPVAMGN